MLILSRVCAEFTNRAGQPVFTVGPRDLLTFLNAPEEIRADPLFRLLVADGSLEAVEGRRDGPAVFAAGPMGPMPADAAEPMTEEAPEAGKAPKAADQPAGAADASGAAGLAAEAPGAAEAPEAAPSGKASSRSGSRKAAR